MRRIFKVFGIILLGILLVALSYVAIYFPPVMAGMAAKTMCSCVFVAGRDAQSVIEKELKVFPGLSSAGIDINRNDSTVEAQIIWKTSKAIFRRGLGCTLLSEATEAEVRSQKPELAHLPNSQSKLMWPDGDLPDTTASTGIDITKVKVAVAEAFDEPDLSKPKNTLAVIVIHNGAIVGEQYADGVNRESRLMGWSMTKSITNALIGIMVHDKILSVDKPAPVAEWRDDTRNQISLHNLLQASSGLKWSESYFVPTSTFHTMFMLSDDKGRYAASRELEFTPGEHWQYSSGSTNILSRMMRQKLGDSLYYKFPYEKLFHKIGMHHALMEVDASGTFVGSSYSFATARDWARFGLLYLNDGVWNNERILPEGWVKYTTTPATGAGIGQYGAQWWLNAGAPGDDSKRKYSQLPTDAYWADGFEEQWVMVLPSKNLVIVRLGISHHGFDFPKLVNGVIDALPPSR